MKVHIQNGEHRFTPETALDRAVLEFPELTFQCLKEATRIVNRCAVILTIKHNSTVVYRGGVQIHGFVDGDEQFDRCVDAMMDQLLTRAAPDLAAWRLANPAPTPKDIPSESNKFSPESDTASS